MWIPNGECCFEYLSLLPHLIAMYNLRKEYYMLKVKMALRKAHSHGSYTLQSLQLGRKLLQY